MAHKIKKRHFPNNSGRIPGLDGLRAIAAFAVFGVHYNQIVRLDYYFGSFSLYTLLANGNYGVSLFFSLSGFLLSIPFWRAILTEAPYPTTKKYILRRAFRIIPAYYLALTILIIFSNLWRVPEARIDIFLHYSFLFNYTEFSIFSINAPFWTLAVEMQFYLLLPLFFLGIRKISFFKPLWVILILGICAYGIHYWLIGSVNSIIPWPFNNWLIWIRPNGAVLNHSIFANFPHFLLGIAAGLLSVTYSNRFEKSNRTTQYIFECVLWICFLSILLLLGSGYIKKIELPHAPYGLPLVPAMLATIILLAPYTIFSKRILESFPLRHIGLISYSLYIFHLPCLNYIDRYMGMYGVDAAEHWIAFGMISLAISTLVATISYALVERPIMKLVHRIF